MKNINEEEIKINNCSKCGQIAYKSLHKMINNEWCLIICEQCHNSLIRNNENKAINDWNENNPTVIKTTTPSLSGYVFGTERLDLYRPIEKKFNKCLKCGNDELQISYHYDTFNSVYHVTCCSCGKMSLLCMSEKDAMENWNILNSVKEEEKPKTNRCTRCGSDEIKLDEELGFSFYKCRQCGNDGGMLSNDFALNYWNEKNPIKG